jgi:hypothetical protein
MARPLEVSNAPPFSLKNKASKAKNMPNLYIPAGSKIDNIQSENIYNRHLRLALEFPAKIFFYVRAKKIFKDTRIDVNHAFIISYTCLLCI